VPDVTLELRGRMVGSEGVLEESIVRGTHVGDLFGNSGLGGRIEFAVAIVFPMSGGQILGERLYFDQFVIRRAVESANTPFAA
jgi:predicted ester cyclase